MKFFFTREPVPVPKPRKLRFQLENAFLIFWTDEPIRLHKTYPDHTFSLYPDTTSNTWFPDMLDVLYEDFVAFLNNKPTQHALTYRQTPKTNFCAFIHQQTNLEFTQINVRNEFCTELMKYKKVLCPGPVMNNVKRPDYMDYASKNENFAQGPHTLPIGV